MELLSVSLKMTKHTMELDILLLLSCRFLLILLCLCDVRPARQQANRRDRNIWVVGWKFPFFTAEKRYSCWLDAVSFLLTKELGAGFPCTTTWNSTMSRAVQRQWNLCTPHESKQSGDENQIIWGKETYLNLHRSCLFKLFPFNGTYDLFLSCFLDYRHEILRTRKCRIWYRVRCSRFVKEGQPYPISCSLEENSHYKV